VLRLWPPMSFIVETYDSPHQINIHIQCRTAFASLHDFWAEVAASNVPFIIMISNYDSLGGMTAGHPPISNIFTSPPSQGQKLQVIVPPSKNLHFLVSFCGFRNPNLFLFLQNYEMEFSLVLFPCVKHVTSISIIGHVLDQGPLQ
jgi:predicted transcriptional regulator